MAQENDSRFAIVATLLAFGLVGGISLLLWALTGRVDRAVQLQSSGGLSLDDALPESLQSRVSAGGQTLFDEASAAKEEGVEAIAQGNYANAVTVLNSALSENPNDPEAFIYRSNARIGDEKALVLAVVAPAG
ncbi:MAG: hypothetical protein AAFN12_17045, partial [Cyanobacteria bacterium J06560_2]